MLSQWHLTSNAEFLLVKPQCRMLSECGKETTRAFTPGGSLHHIRFFLPCWMLHGGRGEPRSMWHNDPSDHMQRLPSWRHNKLFNRSILHVSLDSLKSSPQMGEHRHPSHSRLKYPKRETQCFQMGMSNEKPRHSMMSFNSKRLLARSCDPSQHMWNPCSQLLSYIFWPELSSQNLPDHQLHFWYIWMWYRPFGYTLFLKIKNSGLLTCTNSNQKISRGVEGNTDYCRVDRERLVKAFSSKSKNLDSIEDRACDKTIICRDSHASYLLLNWQHWWSSE